MQSLRPDQLRGLLDPEPTAMLLPPGGAAWEKPAAFGEGWVAVETEASNYDGEDEDLPYPEVASPPDWGFAEDEDGGEDAQLQGREEGPRARAQAAVLLAAGALFLFLVLSGMPAALAL